MPACDRSILGTTRASRRIVEDAGTSGSRGARRAANQPRPNETSGDHPERDSGAPQPRADAAVVLHLRATYFLPTHHPKTELIMLLIIAECSTLLSNN